MKMRADLSRTWWLLFFFLFLGFFTQPQQSKAASSMGAAFVVTPNHQLTSNADLSRKDNLWILVNQSQQQIGINIENKSNQTQNFIVAANTAYTGIDGQIHYDQVMPLLDKSITYRFRDLVAKNDLKITVPANTKKSFAIPLEIPDSALKYRGQVLGAVTAYQLDDADRDSNQTKVGAVNHFAMGFPVALNFGGTQINVNSLPQPFRLQRVQPGIGFRGGLAILADLRNVQAGQFLNFTISGKIMAQGRQQVLYRSQEVNCQMAPNSIYQYQLYWTAKSGLRPGNYRLIMDIEVPGASRKNYHLVRNFTVSRNTAQKLNAKIGIKPNYLIYYLVAAGLGLICLLLVTFWLSRSLRKRQR